MTLQQGLWNVLATGKTLPGYDKQSVVNALLQSNICSEAQAKALVNGRARTVKKSLDNITAQKYKSILEKAGLEIQLQAVSEGKPSLVDTLTLVPLAVQSDDAIAAKESELTSDAASATPNSERSPPLAPHSLNGRQLKSRSRAHKRSLLMGLALFVSLLFLYIVMFSGNDLRDVGGTREANAQITALRAAYALPYLKAREIKAFLEWGDYDELERQLADLNAKVAQDIKWEHALFETFWQISPKKSFNQQELDLWVETKNSVFSHLVRASFYYQAGYEARGGKWSKDTSQAQFDSQRALHKKALSDLLVVMDMDINILPAYTFLIGLASTNGLYVNPKPYLEEANRLFPGGYYHRYQYLRLHMPKWGGSYAAMQAFIDDSKSYFHHNPRLWLLQGFVAAEQGHRLMKRRTGQSCVDQYDIALQFGFHGGWLSHRAACLADIEQFDKALEDVDAALAFGTKGYAITMKRYLEQRM